MTAEDQILCEQYVAKKLDPKSREKFELRLKEEADLMEEVQALYAIRIGRRMELEEELEKIVAEESGGNSRRLWLYAGGGCGGLCVGVVAVTNVWRY